MKPVISIFFHNLCIFNTKNDPKSPKKGKNKDFSKIAIKKRDFSAKVSNFPKFLRFKYISRNNQSFGRSFSRNLLCFFLAHPRTYNVEKLFLLTQRKCFSVCVVLFSFLHSSAKNEHRVTYLILSQCFTQSSRPIIPTLISVSPTPSAPDTHSQPMIEKMRCYQNCRRNIFRDLDEAETSESQLVCRNLRWISANHLPM